MRYIFAGGGSGGHIFPAIAIADEIKILDKDAEILFAGAKGRIEEKIVPSNNYRLETINISGFDRSSYINNLRLPLKLILSLKRCFEILREFRPDVAIGTGGFVCGPVIFAAGILKIPTLIQEGNSYAGKTIKFLSGRADKVVINFSDTEKYLKRKDNIIKIPHPVRSSLTEISRNKALDYFGLSGERKTVFIFGGSQGARGINECIRINLRNLIKSGINVIWQTGKYDYENLSVEFSDIKEGLRLYEFIERMDMAYSAGDVIVCRAGITSIMEMAELGKASVLIPLPTSAENHQEMNAGSLVKKNAAVMIKENEIKVKLSDEILNLIKDERRLSELRSNIKKFSDRNAAKKIAEEAIKLTVK